MNSTSTQMLALVLAIGLGLSACSAAGPSPSEGSLELAEVSEALVDDVSDEFDEVYYDDDSDDDGEPVTVAFTAPVDKPVYRAPEAVPYEATASHRSEAVTRL